MDKQKTGNIIREARIKKNYTQSELGDLLGVSNKAISRWENGDSFPDVGILENLAAVLDLRIQDIVTGDHGTDDEKAVVDVVRVATIQQKERKRRLAKNGLTLVAVFLEMLVGISVFGNMSGLLSDISIYGYTVIMIISMVLMIAGNLSRDTESGQHTGKLCAFSKIIAICSVAWIMILTWGTLTMVTVNIIPFGMKMSSVGPFINYQLEGLFLCNFITLSILVYRSWKRDESLHWGWIMAMSAMNLAVLYSDLLHRLSSTQGMLESLSVRTVETAVITGVFMFIHRRRSL